LAFLVRKTYHLATLLATGFTRKDQLVRGRHYIFLSDKKIFLV
jgi:hypothetical protein